MAAFKFCFEQLCIYCSMLPFVVVLCCASQYRVPFLEHVFTINTYVSVGQSLEIRVGLPSSPDISLILDDLIIFKY